MNVVIVGGGVMGRLFTGRLAAAGENVAVIDASPEVARSLNERGVWIEERDGSVSHAVTRAGTDSTGLESPDIVLFFVKTEHTDDAADRVAPAIGGQTAVVTLQNGFGNAEALAARFPAGQIVYGATEQGGSLAPDGHVAHAHDGDTFVGPYIESLEKMRDTLEVTTVVCGHGPMGDGPDAIDTMIEYLRGLQSSVTEAMRAGRALETTVEQSDLPERFATPDLPPPAREALARLNMQMHRLNVVATYRALEGAAQ